MLGDFKDIVKAVAVSIFVIVIMVISFNFITNYENNKNFEKAVTLEDSYDVYYNGTLVKGDDIESKFKISALKKENVSVEIKEDVQEIYITDVPKEDPFFYHITVCNSLGNHRPHSDRGIIITV